MKDALAVSESGSNGRPLFGGAFSYAPSDTAFEDFVAAVGRPTFDEYMGLTYEESRLDVFWYFPLEDGWSAGDCLVQCAVYDPLNSQLVGSLRSAAR